MKQLIHSRGLEHGNLFAGEKINYIGDSGLGEIIGWLMPEYYPIINGKFHDSLEFFKV